MVLDELQCHAGVEQVGRDGVSEAVAGEIRRQPRALAVVDEARLDLALLEWARPTTEEWLGRFSRLVGEVPPNKRDGGWPQGTLVPEAALQPLDHDAAAGEIHVLAAHERHFTDPQAVVVDQREERPVAGIANDREERLQLRLREVTRKAL